MVQGGGLQPSQNPPSAVPLLDHALSGCLPKLRQPNEYDQAPSRTRPLACIPVYPNPLLKVMIFDDKNSVPYFMSQFPCSNHWVKKKTFLLWKILVFLWSRQSGLECVLYRDQIDWKEIFEANKAENTNLRRCINVRLTSCLTCLDSAAFLVGNETLSLSNPN